MIILSAFLFKAYIYADLGQADYAGRVAAISGPPIMEKAGAWVMQADPVTVLYPLLGLTPRLPDGSTLARRIGYVLILPANIAFFTIDIISFGRQNIGTRFCKATSNCGSVTSAARSALKTVLISSMAFYRAITSTCSCPSPRNWSSAT